MRAVLHLSTMRDRLPFRIVAKHIVAVRPQSFVDNNDDWAQGTAISAISGKEFIVSESYEVVTQMWLAALGEVPAQQAPDLPDWPEFTGEIAYDMPHEQYSWALSSDFFVNTLVCKTAEQANSIVAYAIKRPEYGLVRVSRDFDLNIWRVSQLFRKLRLSDHGTLEEQTAVQAPKE